MFKKLNMLFMLAMNLFTMQAESDFKKIPVGGQAVIEGVLMKGKSLYRRSRKHLELSPTKTIKLISVSFPPITNA